MAKNQGKNGFLPAPMPLKSHKWLKIKAKMASRQRQCL